MYPRTLARIRKLVRDGEYLMTMHAVDEMDADDFTAFDVEHGILTASIVERQRDAASGQMKYVLTGRTRDGRGIGIVARLSPPGNVVIITVYEAEA